MLTKKELAALASSSRWTIYRMLKKHPAHTLSGSNRGHIIVTLSLARALTAAMLEQSYAARILWSLGFRLEPSDSSKDRNNCRVARFNS